MNKKSIPEGIENIVRESVEKIDDNLKAIISVGSINNEDFVEGLSDIDLLYVLGHINSGLLKVIHDLRNDGSEYTGYKVDIKPFTLTEFSAAVKGVGSFEFFTGWGLEMIRSGKQPCLYRSSDFPLDYQIDEERFKQDALERAHYYITKLRKVISSDEPLLIRGEKKVVSGDELLKVAGSSVKNVLRFCLAYQGVQTDGTVSILAQSQKCLGDIQEIAVFLASRDQKHFDREMMLKAYDLTEKIYQTVIQNA